MVGCNVGALFYPEFALVTLEVNQQTALVTIYCFG